MLSTISVVAGTIAILIGILTTLYRIAKSVTTTQVSVVNIQKEILEIKIILEKTDNRIDKVCEKATLNEYRIHSLEEDVKEAKNNCKEIQSAKRQERLG